MISYLSYTLRRLIRERGFTATILITLALCIGANVVIFAVVDAILVRPLPFPHADRIVTTINSYPKAGTARASSSIANYYDRKENIGAFESTSLYKQGNAIVGQAGSPQRMDRDQVTPEFFSTLGVQLAMGRAFTEGEMARGNSQVMILSHEYWKNQFESDPNILSRKVTVDGVPHIVVGVLSSGFRYLDSQARFYIPLSSSSKQRSAAQRHFNGYQLIARLKPGATLAVAQDQINAFNQVQMENSPSKFATEGGYRTYVHRLHADIVQSVRPILLLLQAGVLSLLVIGGVNIINLLLIRAYGRTKEFAVRQALGAGGRHITKDILLETMMLTLVGGALGIFVGGIGISLLSSLGTHLLPLGANIVFDTRVALVALATSGLLGVALAIPIVLVSLRTRLSAALQSETRGGTSSRAAQRVRHGFIIIQVALAFVLLSGAGLLGLSLHKALSIPPGFHSDQVLTARIILPTGRYGGAERITFFERALNEVRAQPGVLHAGLNYSLPFGAYGGSGVVKVEGIESDPNDPIRVHHISIAMGDYWSALDIPLIEGRFINDTDLRSEQRTCVVDQTFAQRYWPGQSALDHRIANSGTMTDKNTLTIVGVVGNVKQRGLTETNPIGTIYPIYQAAPINKMYLVIRSAISPEPLGSSLIKIVQGIDPALTVDDIKVLQTRIDDSLVTQRSPALLAGIFAAVALIIAAVGTYGVLAYAVGQRRREIGVRMALGALPSQIRKLFLSLGAKILLIGITLGALGAWGAGVAMQSVLFDVAPFHPGIVLVTAGVMIVVVLLATLLPSQRAARLSPVEALRDE